MPDQTVAGGFSLSFFFFKVDARPQELQAKRRAGAEQHAVSRTFTSLNHVATPLLLPQVEALSTIYRNTAVR